MMGKTVLRKKGQFFSLMFLVNFSLLWIPSNARAFQTERESGLFVPLLVQAKTGAAK